MNRKILTHLLYPIVIYTIISIEIAALVIAGVESDQLSIWASTSLFLLILIAVFAKRSKPQNITQGAKMGFVWATLFITLDVFIVAVPFTGVSYFLDWRSWIPYVMAIIVPAIIGSISGRSQKKTLG